MNLNDKIKQILLDKNLTPSHFADEVGIQRSSMSHILAGRNKPSLDIVQKIIRRFPDLGMEWIMDDEDESSDLQDSSNKKTFTEVLEPTKIEPGPAVPQDVIQDKTASAIATLQPEDRSNLEEKIIDRVMIFYKDGTFKAYRSEV